MGEVHRLKSDLDAEVSTRTLKDTELQGRLEREVHEFSRRVERLTAATSELGGDLQKTRSSVMRTGRLSVASSLGSANLTPDRTRLTRLGSVATGLRNVDSCRRILLFISICRKRVFQLSLLVHFLFWL